VLSNPKNELEKQRNDMATSELKLENSSGENVDGVNKGNYL
jgi:hypothetical protein